METSATCISRWILPTLPRRKILTAAAAVAEEVSAVPGAAGAVVAAVAAVNAPTGKTSSQQWAPVCGAR